MRTKPQSKERKVTVKDDVSQKEFDSTHSAVVLNAAGQVVREPGKVRKELVEELLILLQNTLDDKLGGMNFMSKVDLVENHVHGTVAYAESLKEAATTIMHNYPSEDKDAALQEIVELCDVVEEGANRVRPYLDVIKNFSTDLDSIKMELHTQIQTLFQEI